MKIQNSTMPRTLFQMPLQSTNQRGVSLVELLVGIAIGLLVVAVAMGALMVSRGISGTVSDASSVQQQAAYAMRVIGLQMRQAGSLYLNPDINGTGAGDAYMQKVAFEAKSPASGALSFDPVVNTISASANSPLIVGFRRYKDKVFNDATEQSLMRNCLGGPDNTSTDTIVQSEFRLNGNELQCVGNGVGPQSIVQNVANFQVQYISQDNDPTTKQGASTLVYTNTAPGATDYLGWSRIQAVEVCLVLYGTEAIDLPSDGSAIYTDCDGSPVDMSTLTGARARRMHIAFRNVFQIRSQGLVGTVILPTS